MIGGPEAEAPNLISGNGHNGVRISGTNALLNQVVHNRIGTNGLGTAEVHNGIHGVFITAGASFNIVGDTDGTNTRNLISGNTEDGVRILGSTALFNQVIGNYIGTDHLGAAAVGNKRGVSVGNTSALIGGPQVAHRNVISGNREDGVYLDSATNTIVQNNFIGTKENGMSELPNKGNGVVISNSTNVQIGGTGAEGNVISGNGEENEADANKANGVMIISSDFTRVQGNWIGTDKTGTVEVSNHGDGVSVNSGSSTLVGGDATEGNRIAGNKRVGVSGKATDINNNKIGVKPDGTALPNLRGGIALNGNGATVSQNEVGYNGGPGVAVLSGTGHSITLNTIHDNAGSGADIQGGSSLTLTGNTITDNDGRGVYIHDTATAVTVGGLDAGEANSISGNADDALVFGSGINHLFLSNEILGNVEIWADASVGGEGEVTGSVYMSNAGNFTVAHLLEPFAFLLEGDFTQTAGSTTVSLAEEMIVAGSVTQSGGILSISSDTGTFGVAEDFTLSGGALGVGDGTLSVNGDFFQSGGSTTIAGSTTLGTVEVAGSYSHNGGFLSVGDGVLSVAGDFDQSDGGIGIAGSSTFGTIEVAGSFSQSGGTFSALLLALLDVGESVTLSGGQVSSTTSDRSGSAPGCSSSRADAFPAPAISSATSSTPG